MEKDSYTMIAKPLRALELHHTMIQLLIIGDVSWINHCDYRWQHPILQSILPHMPRKKTCGNQSKSEQRMWQWWLMYMSNFCCSVRMQQHFSSTSWRYILWSSIKRYWNLVPCIVQYFKPQNSLCHRWNETSVLVHLQVSLKNLVLGPQLGLWSSCPKPEFFFTNKLFIQKDKY